MAAVKPFFYWENTEFVNVQLNFPGPTKLPQCCSTLNGRGLGQSLYFMCCQAVEKSGNALLASLHFALWQVHLCGDMIIQDKQWNTLNLINDQKNLTYYD